MKLQTGFLFAALTVVLGVSAIIALTTTVGVRPEGLTPLTAPQHVVRAPLSTPLPPSPSALPPRREVPFNEPFTLHVNEEVSLGTLYLAFKSAESVAKQYSATPDPRVFGYVAAHEGQTIGANLANFPLGIVHEWRFRNYRIVAVDIPATTYATGAFGEPVEQFVPPTRDLPTTIGGADSVRLRVTLIDPIREVSYNELVRVTGGPITLGTLRIQFKGVESSGRGIDVFGGNIQLGVTEHGDELTLWINEGEPGRQFHNYRIAAFRVGGPQGGLALRIAPAPVQTPVTEEQAVRIAIAKASSKLSTTDIYRRELRGNEWELRILCGLDCGYTVLVDAKTGAEKKVQHSTIQDYVER